jgi:hypothetical protein
VWASSIGTGRVQTVERYLGCHIHVDTLVSWRIQSEAGGCGCYNQCTCVYVWVRIMGIKLVHVLLYGQIYYSEEVVQNPPSLHLLWERVRILRKRNHEKWHTETQMSVSPQYKPDCNALSATAQSARSTPIQPRSNREKDLQKYYVFRQFVQGGHPLPCSTMYYGKV